MMKSVKRTLNIDLPPRQSAFLWGARQVGKTTLLRERFPQATFFDLLDTKLHLDLLTRPWLLRERLIGAGDRDHSDPVIIDEVQKAPALLDEVHWLIENRGTRLSCRLQRS